MREEVRLFGKHPNHGNKFVMRDDEKKLENEKIRSTRHGYTE